MGPANNLTEANIWPKFNENLSKGLEIWSGQESVTEGQTKAIPVIPLHFAAGD